MSLPDSKYASRPRSLLSVSLFEYPLAIGVIGTGLALQAIVNGPLGVHGGYECTLLAVVIVAWLCCLQATLIGIFLAALAETWIFLEPRGTLRIANPSQAVGFAIFITVAVIIALLAERLKRSRQSNEAALRELVRSDQARLSSERHLDEGLNAIAEPVWMLTPLRDAGGGITDFVVEFANRAAIPAGNAGRPLVEVAPQHAALGLIAKYASVLETGIPLEVTATLPGAAGAASDPEGERVVEVRADRRGADGVVVRWRDVSERRRSDAAIRLSEQRYRSLIRAMGAIVWTTSATGEVVAPQPDWSAFTGMTFDELRGEGWLEAVHPDDRDNTRGAWTRAVVQRREYEIEHRLRRGDGEYRNMTVRGVPVIAADGEVREWVGVHTDVTESRRASQIVADSERQLRRVLNGLYAFVGVMLPDGTLVGANEAPLRDAGLTAADVIGRKIWDTYWYSHAPQMQETLRDWTERAAHGEVIRQDVPTRMAGGAMVTVDFMLSPLRDEQGTITHLIPSGVDVSERIRAQADLADRERRFRRLYDSNLAGIVFYRPDGALSDPNDAFLQLLGYGRDRIGGLRWQDLILPEWSEVESASEQALATEGRYGPFEAELLGADGKRVPVLITGAELDPAGAAERRGYGVRSIVDLSHVKRVEEALRQTEADLRMANESLELRIQERTLELQHRSDQLRALALDLTETESRERKRLAQLLHDHFQQLVSAAKLKVGIVRRKLTDSALIETVKEVESLLEETINASRSLATELSPPVLHDAGLGPALEWLARRMERDHNLTVSLSVDPNTEPDNEQVRTIVFECARELLFNVVKHASTKQATLSLSMAAEGLLQLAVSDGGRGFDAHAMEMKAKPDGSFGLFSIKERLGLLGGLVKVRSHPGEGTTVTLTVPVTVKSEASVGATGKLFESTGETPAGGVPDVRVMVADDHKLFREGLISLLSQESFVHIVGQANDGEEAVALARQLKPDILIIDVTMPKLNGVQVTAQVMKDLPATKVIGLSMHERDDMANAMREAGAAAYCSKGGPTEALLNILRGVAARP